MYSFQEITIVANETHFWEPSFFGFFVATFSIENPSGSRPMLRKRKENEEKKNSFPSVHEREKTSLFMRVPEKVRFFLARQPTGKSLFFSFNCFVIEASTYCQGYNVFLPTDNDSDRRHTF
jgi:hypothetical protein